MTFSQKIADDLTLRSLRDDVDKERFADFSTVYNNPDEGATCACLTYHHPEMTNDNFWIVESDTTHKIVSSTCLIPWTLRFAGLDLRAAQLEMVLTHPEYRGRGLVRTQVKHFEQVVKEHDFDLSFIWGIPYYYRQYGYAYTIEGATFESLPVWKIPATSLGAGLSIRLRPAIADDIPCLTELYNSKSAGWDFSTQRSSAYWRYLLENAHHPIEMLESSETGEVIGYAVISRLGKSINILENSLPNSITSLAFLQALKTQVSEQIQISWPGNTPLAELAMQLGSQTVPGGQWLLRVPDMTRFLNKMIPAFEQRLSNSAWANLSAEIKINLFREAFSLRFEKGELASVDSIGFVDSSMGADGGDFCIPPEAFLRLLFGYRALHELFDAWPDIVVKPEARALINILFPRLQPFLYTPYHDLGASRDFVAPSSVGG
jgi:predicted acetyltransferase